MLTEPCDAMSRVLSARLSHLRVVRAMWATSVRRALQYTLDMDDQPVLVDVLNSSQQPLACEMSLELAQDLLPAVGRSLSQTPSPRSSSRAALRGELRLHRFPIT